MRADRPEMGVVLITHYQRLLDELTPDHVHVMVDGRIVASGGMEIAETLERDGYEAFRGLAATGGARVSVRRHDPHVRHAAVKAQFPLLRRTIDGAPLHYLDSANTSQKPQCVIDAMTHFTETSYAPINRSAYRLAAEATDAYEGARAKVARFVNARHPDEIVFTKNATEALNLVAQSWGRANLGRRRRRRAHPHGAPRQRRAVAHARRRAGHRAALDPADRRRPARPDDARRSCSTAPRSCRSRR